MSKISLEFFTAERTAIVVYFWPQIDVCLPKIAASQSKEFLLETFIYFSKDFMLKQILAKILIKKNVKNLTCEFVAADCTAVAVYFWKQIDVCLS